MQTVRDERSIGQLLKELSSETSTLLRQEVDLAKTEMSETASRVGNRLGELAVGGGVAFAGALALLAAVILAVAALLYQWMSPAVANWVAPLVVGAIFAAVGYSMVHRALTSLRGEHLTPRKTAQSMQENREWLQAKIQ
ncbi:MAG: phage holin family protein [Acidobacteriota bacterium]|nr:phage holin family protein [Acidobacteriota bacterium]